ncbi:VOC family protein [Actinopolymorpha sp. B11F2]|uniref:VOC family protein n=1 Tax=Actinopolymorpha sp. B11F2 TaxID=3160862 RepID=UPI0032E36EDF
MAHVLKCLIPTIGSPQTLNGKEGRWELAAFYCELLGMKVVYEPWLLIADGAGSAFFLAFDGDGWNDRRPPRWPDPEFPQQMHLDLGVPDVDTAAELATGLGATLLADSGSFRVYADPVGHPFCLYPDGSTDRPVVRRLVFDCFSPRHLASFYEGFLQARGRVEDAPERVVVALDDDLPDLAFQHAQFRAARWPDPAYPSQVHVDYRWHDHLTARRALQRAQRLGAIRLPQAAGSGVYADPASHPFCIQNDIPWAFEVSGFYLNPPECVVAYCVDETVQSRGDDGQLPRPPGVPDEHSVDDQRRDLIGVLGAIDVDHGLTDAQRRVTRFQAFLTPRRGPTTRSPLSGPERRTRSSRHSSGSSNADRLLGRLAARQANE